MDHTISSRESLVWFNKRSFNFEKYLEISGLISTVEAERAKYEALESLRFHIRKWITTFYKPKLEEGKFPEKEYELAQFIPFGSYKMGITTNTSDIDVVCAVPAFVLKDDVFESLVPYFRTNCSEEITSMLAIPNAYVPIINLKYNGIEMDLSFCHTKYKYLPDHVEKRLEMEELTRDMTRGCADESVRSLNGPRVSMMVCQLMSDDMPRFQTVLRAMRYWGKRRGIYGNVYGFLGGVNFAILAAFLCSEYAKAKGTPLSTFFQFFCFFLNWEWEKKPVFLANTDAKSKDEELIKISRDPRQPPMKLLTPAYPSMNSTHNVSPLTLNIMREEALRAKIILEHIAKVKEEDAVEGKDGILFQKEFDDLFSDYKSEFFTDTHRNEYKDMLLVVKFVADTHEEILKWTGYGEAQIRIIVNGLAECAKRETNVFRNIRPYPRLFPIERGPDPDDPLGIPKHEMDIYIRLSVRKGLIRKPNINDTLTYFNTKLENWPEKAPSMAVTEKLISFKDVPECVFSKATKKRVVKRVIKTRPKTKDGNTKQPECKKSPDDPVVFPKIKDE